MTPALRTPEGSPSRCPVCGEEMVIEPSLPPGDAPCPRCGCLLWFDPVLLPGLDFLVPEAFLANLGQCAKEEAIHRMVASLEAAGALSAAVSDEVEQRLLQREQLSSTGIGRGIALPHVKHSGLKRPVGCLARSNSGIEFESLDGKPVHLLVLLVSPADQPGDHLRTLAKVSDWLRREALSLP